MKKGCGWTVFVVALITAAVVAVVVSVAVLLRDRDVSALRPLGISDIDQVGKSIGEAVKASSGPTGAAASAGTETVIQKPATLPSRLASTVTPAMLAERFEEKRPNEIRNTRLQAMAWKSLEGALSLVSKKEAAGWAWERGQELMTLGEWDEARRCFWVSLDAPLHPGVHKYACARLAWLEEDPEKALKYLEASCQGDDATGLMNAIDLCRKTGSRELANYYLARLRFINPELAEMFDKER